MFFFFAVWAGAWAPAQTAKKKHGPRPNSKKKTPEKPKQQKRPDNKKNHTLTADELMGRACAAREVVRHSLPG